MALKSKSRRTPAPDRASSEEIRQLRQERDIARVALQESEHRFASLFNIAPMGYQSLDENGCFIEVNPAWLEMLGYTRDEVIGKRFSDLLTPEMVNEFKKRFPRFKSIGSTHTEFQMLHKDGSLRLIEFEGRIGYKPDGSFKQTHCVLSDITDHKKAEEATHSSEDKRRRLFETMKEGVFYQLADGTLTDVNEAALRMFGVTREEFLHRTSMHSEWDVILEDGSPLPGAEHPSMKVLSTGKPVLDLVVGIRNPQTHVYTWVSTNGVPEFHDGESTPYQAVVTMHDLTERKRTEQELSESKLRFQRTQQLAKTGSWEYSFDSDNFWASDEALHIYAFNSQDAPFTADLVESCIPERERVHQALLDLVEEDRKYDLEFEIHPYDGSAPRIVSSMAECLRDDQGKVIKVVGAILDITERKQAEEELLKQIEELRRWHTTMLGREARMRELKHEINRLHIEAGKPIRFTSVEAKEGGTK